ncbi:hypothetical protein STSP2_00746 [Anaerohalosphaera lusitana]|uniref:BNR repeat-containing family member n=1 Tax=Anaerohalosphaera lusitana TaxID=1936003 RepID=A0A1U9NIM7_9BACT|nr:BNR repeat-containing protein [Anaerohalosphaera lusitana]AQT67598.1 hypothetical protein STSP2_00746 [Anaerohalosphaera lusitana]
MRFVAQTTLIAVTILLIASLLPNPAVIAAETDSNTIIPELPNAQKPFVADKITIDKVWPGHRVGFFLMTADQRQYAAYYNADRQMTVAMRKLGDEQFTKFHPQTPRKEPPHGGSAPSATLGWDSHNSVTMALDRDGYIHLSGNMHGNNLTYFRSTEPYDISTLVLVEQMTGELEDRVTYPKFLTLPDGRLVFGYRHGGSGNGNNIYNVYDTDTKTWSRLLDTPLHDGQDKNNAYYLGPKVGPDGWFHMSWVWRQTPDCSTNHDLSYAKSPDLVNWYTAAGKEVELPITLETPGVIVDPIPPQGGIINGSGKVGFDHLGRAVLAYHKFDDDGNTQAYTARYEDNEWAIDKLTDWDHRWYFEGYGTLPGVDVRLGEVKPLGVDTGLMTLNYRHVKYGSGTWLLDEQLEKIGTVDLPRRFPPQVTKVTSKFPGMTRRISIDKNSSRTDNTKYVMAWESLGSRRDKPLNGPLPDPSKLTLYEIKYKD